MRSRRTILPGENAAAYEHRLQTWQVELGAENDAQKFLVSRAVKASWMLERADGVEKATGKQRINAVVEGTDEQEADEATALAAQLDDDPSLARVLRKTPAGVRLMLAEFAILRERLRLFTSLLGTQRRRSLSLLGKRREDVLRDDPIATKWVRAQIGAIHGQEVPVDEVRKFLGGKPPEGMFEPEFQIRLEILAKSVPAKADAHAQLKAYVAEAIAELEEHLEQVEALAMRNRKLAVRAARVDRTVDGSRLQQYAQAQDRSFHAALRRLELLQKPRRPGPAKGPGKAERPAAKDDGTAGSRRAGTQASGPCHPPDSRPTPAPTADSDAGAPEPAGEPPSQPRQSAQSAAAGAGNPEKLTVEPIFAAAEPEPASEPARAETPEKLTVEPIFDSGTAGPAVTTRSDSTGDGLPSGRQEVSTLGLGRGPETCGLSEGGVGRPAPTPSGPARCQPSR
jgi:hypothetical protein